MGKLERTKDEEFQLNALKVACLRQNGVDRQNEIAERLGISQPQVSRLLKHLVDEEWILTKTEIQRHNVPEDLYQKAVAELSLEPELTEKLKTLSDCFQGVSICGGPGQDYFPFAAGVLASLLRDSELTGVAWGLNLAEVVKRVPDQSPPHRRFHCVPLSGEPVELVHRYREGYQSTSIAATLQQRMNGLSPKDVPLLTGVPAYIPSKFFDEDLGNSKNSISKVKTILEFIECNPGYSKVFGRDEGCVEELDTLLTGIGLVAADEKNMGTFVRERALQEPELADHLERFAIGDIAGILYGAAKSSEVEDLNRGLVGLKEEHIRHCAARARDTGKPGVIVITTGAAEGKAKAIKVAVELGYINRLVLPMDISAALLREFP